MSIVKVFTDGASRGNPGAAGIGIAVYDESDNIITTHHEYLGTATNNQAEYKALLKGVQLVYQLRNDGREIKQIRFFLDSELIVKQVKGEYKVKDAGLQTLNRQFHALIKNLAIPYTITHVKRALNKAADELANKGIDSAKS